MKQSTRRLLTYGSNATIVTIIVVIVHMMLYAVIDNRRTRWDFSEGASNTLQADTVSKLQLLDSYGEPVKVTAFNAQNSQDDAYLKDRAIRDLLRELDYASEVVSVQMIDFDRERLTAERLGVTDYGHVVIQRGQDRVDIRDRELFRRVGRGKDRSLQFLGEEAIARAFGQLLTDTRQTIYLTTNHGEPSISNIAPDGISDMAAALDLEGYDVKELNLMSTDREGELPSVPDDAAAVLIVRPQRPFTAAEEDLLLSYIGRGGAVLMALDVGLPVPDLARRVGVAVAEGVAYSKKAINPYWDRPVLKVTRHELTNELVDDQLVPVFASAAPLLWAVEPPKGLRYFELLSTTTPGWIERGGAFSDGVPTYEQGVDGEGAAKVGVVVTVFPGQGLVRATKGAARLVIFGDGEAFTNALMNEGPGNRALAINTAHWLAGQDKRLEYGGGRITKVRRLAITREELGTLRLISLGLMPLVVLVIGVLIWRSRRGR